MWPQEVAQTSLRSKLELVLIWLPLKLTKTALLEGMKQISAKY
jgi:hypothetical protein